MERKDTYGMKPMENYETIYEIFDSIDGSNVLDTEDCDVAEEYHEKGYLVDEHRIQKIRISNKEYVTTIVTINW